MKNKLRELKKSGIARKWFFVTLLPALATVALALASVYFITRQNYYYSAQQSIGFRIRAILDALPEEALSQQDRYRSLVGLVEDFAEKDRFEFMVLDSDGKVLICSSGFAYSSYTIQRDFGLAQSSADGRGTFIGHTENGDHVIAVTQLLADGYADASAIRLVSSLSGIDARIQSIVNLSCAVGAALLALICLTGSIFVRSLAQPLQIIGSTAEKIATGSLSERVENRYDGEIGTLCDTINEMAAELERSDRMKNDFISSISHELRTPLTSIKGWGETLAGMGTEDPEMLGKGLEIIISETDRLSLLVEDLLDFSRLESLRALTIQPAPLDLVAELSDAVLTVEQRARKQDVEVRYEEPEHPIIVMADKNRLKQVFTNVFDNALKYSPRKKAITVSLQLEGRFAVVSIRDRGPGIPKQELHKVTRRYYRASNSVYGTGIGLALVDEIMRAHGGRLKIESEFGHGTNVMLQLPMLTNQQVQ